MGGPLAVVASVIPLSGHGECESREQLRSATRPRPGRAAGVRVFLRKKGVKKKNFACGALPAGGGPPAPPLLRGDLEGGARFFATNPLALSISTYALLT